MGVDWLLQVTLPFQSFWCKRSFCWLPSTFKQTFLLRIPINSSKKIKVILNCELSFGISISDAVPKRPWTKSNDFEVTLWMLITVVVVSLRLQLWSKVNESLRSTNQRAFYFWVNSCCRYVDPYNQSHQESTERNHQYHVQSNQR